MKINEIFHSLQGEGPRAGRHAVFLRLAGCNLRCSKCDTPYAFEEGTEMDALGVLAELKRLKAFDISYVVVTGGEPLLQAKELNRVIAATPPNVEFGVETNGTIYEVLHGTIQQRVHYVVSPKGFGFGDAKGKELYKTEWSASGRHTNLVLFKFVVSTEEDVEKAVRFAEKERIPKGLVWIMPEGVTREKIFNRWPSVFEWAVKYGVHASMRLHTLAFGAKRGI